MLNGKSSGKHSHQLLFSEAIAQPKTMAAQTAPPCSASSPTDLPALEATDHILQEIAAVGHHLEAKDKKITDLTVASTSIRADIAGFRETINDLDQHLAAVEGQVAALPDQETELRSLRAKVINLEDRSRRDNVRFFALQNNKGSVSSPQLLWAAAKAMIRGQLMRDAAISNAQRRDQQSKLEDCIVQATWEYTRTPTLSIRRHLELAKMELNSLYTSRAEYALQQMKGRHYEHGEKEGRLLVAQLHQREAALAISGLRNHDDTFITHPQAIAAEFVRFYQALYTPDTTEDTDRLDAFLERANIPCLSAEGSALLEGDISKEELQQAIANLPYHKVPGEDGFTSEFYKWTGAHTVDALYEAFGDVTSLSYGRKQVPEFKIEKKG
ncbi:hypothetical protein NDU88_005520 [Pleurodeles waltl]|uniref:Uncharacterized protein n=1 Tax=Pleurodeles waltl TaxID=8319 RepID=A0AAV7WC16_PLEWA|nr:hypothetical protein NDU88_005520 [Pleurodeles waltl]